VIAAIRTTVAEFVGDEFVVHQRPGRLLPKVVCADGFTMSVQASEYHYCTPRETTDRYVSVEVGFPSERPEPWAAWESYCESPESPTDTVYGHVPASLVAALVELHGGVA
jgi:hypothetical protein